MARFFPYRDTYDAVGQLLQAYGLDPIRDWRKWQGILLRLEWKRGEWTEERYHELAGELHEAPTLEWWELLYIRACMPYISLANGICHSKRKTSELRATDPGHAHWSTKPWDRENRYET